MQLPNINKKKDRVRHQRIERARPVEIPHEEGNLWAISYSDLLMVLMSFFVIFFSFEDAEKSSIIDTISVAIVGGLNEGSGSGTGSGTGTGAGTGGLGAPEQRAVVEEEQAEKIARVDSRIYAALSGEQEVEKASEEDHLIINFQHNIYPKRGYQLNAKLRDQIRSVLTQLTPYRDEVNLVFIGHTDSTPVVNRSRHLSSNFGLSTLRATKALEFAINEGFPPSSLFAQGGAQNSRDSRTLSIRIESKPVKNGEK